MSMVQLDLPGARVLDLFAGSGALGLEALSRGAVSATFVEQHPAALRTLAANVEGQGLARAVADRWVEVPFARVLGVEHERGEEMPAGGATRRYGSTAITLYRLPDA